MTIEELKKLREGITPGPWRFEASQTVVQVSDMGKGYPLNVYPDCEYVVGPRICTCGFPCTPAIKDEDGVAIAATPDLLSELISLKEWKEELRGKIEKMRSLLPDGSYDGYDPKNEMISAVLSLLDQQD